MARRYWLIKSEPSAYSIDDLKRDKSTLWEGVRNYQARNFMMKEMKVGDEALFYHSSAEPPGAVGIAEVSGAAEPDPTQFDSGDSHYDPKAHNSSFFSPCYKYFLYSCGDTFAHSNSLKTPLRVTRRVRS